MRDAWIVADSTLDAVGYACSEPDSAPDIGGNMAVETIAPPELRHEAGERYQFTVHEYHRMAELGILDWDIRVELIEGDIVWMAPIGGSHVESVMVANSPFVRAVGDDAFVSIQSSIRLNDRSEPQPDITIVRRRRYDGALPTPEDVFLVVEIADSSLKHDRDTKVALYASSDVPEVWIVDLNTKVLLRFADPIDGHYRIADRHERGARMTLSQLPSATIAVNDFFPD